MGAFSIDDFRGIPVTCTADRWTLKIETNHPELRHREGDVIEAIRDPEVVLQDRDFSNRRHFVRRYDRGLYLAVVVEYRFTANAITGHLVTAFLRSRLRPNDSIIFLRVRN